MKCPFCGAEIDDNSKLCSQCGANITSAESTEIKDAENVKPLKKPFFKRKGGIVLIVILVVLIAGAITAFALRDNIMRGILGPAKYYMVKEGLNIGSLSDEDFGLKGDFTLGQDYSSILVFTGADYSKVNMDIEWSNSQDKRKIDIDFLGLIKLKIQSQDKLVSMALNDNSITCDTKSLNDFKNHGSNNGNSQKKSEEYLSGWDKMAWIYDFSNSPVIGEIEKNCVTTDEKKYNGIECTVDTFRFTGKNISVILNSLADLLEKDKDTQAIYKEYISNNILSSIIKNTSTPKEISKILRDMANESLKSRDVIEYSVYYDGGDIVNREYKSKEDTVTLSSFNKDEEKYISFSYNSIKGEFKVTDTPDVSDVHIDKDKAVPFDKIMDSLKNSLGSSISDFDNEDSTDKGILDNDRTTVFAR